jgi:tetratricopeptide (TPR) repeat protein
MSLDSPVISLDPQPNLDPISQERMSKLLEMAFWHNDVGNIDSAILACEAALSLNPKSTTAHSLLGSLYEKKHDDEQAIKHLEAVLALNPDSSADATKLDQLRRGIHVKSISPVGYRWLPPALSGINLGGLSRKFERVDSPAAKGGQSKITPLAYSGATVVIILVAGALLIHSSSSTAPKYRTSRTMTVSVDPSTRVAQAAVPQTQQTAVAPMVQYTPAPKSPTPEFGSTQSIKTTPDVFAEKLPSYSGTGELSSGVPNPQFILPASRNKQHKAVKGIGSLPPLNLRAIPHANDVSPAPVSVPSMASVANMPQHTVVVTQLGSDGTGQVAAPADQTSSDIGGGPGIMHITVHDSSNNSSVVSDNGSGNSSSNGYSASDDQGTAHQQSAMLMAQQGDYAAAQSEYVKAIRLFKKQLTAGHNVEAAKRGLRACQIGLQICQQSQ